MRLRVLVLGILAIITANTRTVVSIPPSAEECRCSILEPKEVIHAVHMTGNWGTNRESENTLPPEYFEYLRDLNVNWVGISVGLHYDDSMDSTVEREYSEMMNVPTFSDDFLREMIRLYHQHGFCVYLTLAFESHEAEQAEHPVYRWQLGAPTLIWWDPNMPPEFWPWAIDHPDHERFVAEFWETYTQQAVHFGQLAEDEGVALYSLGTETEPLFRSRSGGDWPNDFGEQLRSMTTAVRAVYTGPLTYDMHCGALVASDFFGPGSDHLWEDMGLDVIGVSAYFPLVDSPPTRVLSVEELEKSWEAIFQDYLIPLQAANPDQPIYFTEFGAADSVKSPYDPNIDNFSCRFYDDADENGLDDGEETQANIYQALFNVMDRHPGVVNGTFLWEMWMADNEQWAVRNAQERSNSVRDKLAEDVVRAYYGAAPRATQIDLYIEIPTPFAVEESLVIYDDALGEGWEIWPWQAEVDTAVESVVHSGQMALGVTLDGGGIGLNNPRDLSEYAYLEFYVNGGSQGGQDLGSTIWDVDNDMQIGTTTNLCRVTSLATLPPDEWVLVRLPLQHLDLSGKQVTINIFSIGDQPAPQFFLDDIRLVASGIGVAPPRPSADNVDWNSIPNSLAFAADLTPGFYCEGDHDFSNAQFWGRQGCRVRGIGVGVSQHGLAVSIELHEGDSLGEYGYLVGFRSGDISFYAILTPHTDRARLSMDSEGHWQDIAAVMGDLYQETTSFVRAWFPIDLFEDVFPPEMLLESKVDFHIDYGSWEARRELFFFPGAGSATIMD